MAQNTTEDTKSSVDNTMMSEVCTVTKVVSCNDMMKRETTDADNTESVIEESADNAEKKKDVPIAESLNSEEQTAICKVDCNEDSNKQTDLEKETSSKGLMNETETKENNVEQSNSAETKSGATTETDTFICEEEERLNEILKVVHGELDIKYFQKSVSQSANAKDECEDIDEKEQQPLKLSSIAEKDISDNIKRTAALENEEEKGDSTECMEKIEERSEVGIVGPPTAVSELINEEELGGDSALSADPKDHVAEWVENSVKADALTPTNVREEVDDNITKDDRQNKKKNIAKTRTRQKNDGVLVARKSQKIVSNIIKKSIKCLNKMHAMDGAGGSNVETAERPQEEISPRVSPNVPQNQQNGAALPEEAAAAPADRTEQSCHVNNATNANSSTPSTSRQRATTSRANRSNENAASKRKLIDEQTLVNGPSTSKKFCSEQRQQYILSLIACEKGTSEEYKAKASELKASIKRLADELRAKEMEWNEILAIKKANEEAYDRLQRKIRMIAFTERSGQLDVSLNENLSNSPQVSKWETSGGDSTSPVPKKRSPKFKEVSDEDSPDVSSVKNSRLEKVTLQQTSSKTNVENSHRLNEASSPEYRQVAEGRQGARVDVKSIIESHRLQHPETVPRRGRRMMRNSVNVGLTAGGAMVETGHNADSRPSSTDSCKSNPNVSDANNSMSFKDALVKFARLSQQQGEPVKTPQDYPDVTLHPVPASATQNTATSQLSTQAGSLLHGILTQAQSSRPATFSPTLARLLTAPERERNSSAATTTAAATSIPQQTAATQHILQTYSTGSNLSSISELLSSSKARTEITITPVVNSPAQSHFNNVIQVEDVEEEAAVIDNRDSQYSASGRDPRTGEERDNPPPQCQGCYQRPAQFVCAGCANQWYCSRQCQINAWDVHSEVCSG